MAEKINIDDSIREDLSLDWASVLKETATKQIKPQTKNSLKAPISTQQSPKYVTHSVINYEDLDNRVRYFEWDDRDDNIIKAKSEIINTNILRDNISILIEKILELDEKIFWKEENVLYSQCINFLKTIFWKDFSDDELEYVYLNLLKEYDSKNIFAFRIWLLLSIRNLDLKDYLTYEYYF